MTLTAKLGTLFLVFLLFEYLAGRLTNKHRYDHRELFANMVSNFGNRIIRLSFGGWTLFLLSTVEQWSLFVIPKTLPLFMLTFFLVDYVYYWEHRLTHAVRVLWLLHEVHHSSRWFNFSTAVRLSWFAPFVVPFIFLPLALVGIPPAWIVASLGINLVFQFFLHTEWVGKLGPIEGILNTPSAHRVHHASNAGYVDKNFGGVFVLWDRLHGTYAKENEPCRFGLTTEFSSQNPLVIQLAPFVSYYREWRRDNSRKGS